MREYNNTEELYHYGVLGMKWGVRRYQNEDGTLTPAGQKRVYKSLKKYTNQKDKRARLGQAVGEDQLITKAASRLKPARDRYDKALNEYTSMTNKMESEHHKEFDRLDAKYGETKTYDWKKNQSWNTIRKKYGAECDKLETEFYKQSEEYGRVSRQVVTAFLGKYSDMPVSKISGVHSTSGILADEALDTQIDWGLALGRLKDD